MHQPDRGERLAAALERDGSTCVWCGRAFSTKVPPTTDHLVPKVKGGPSWLENEVAACRRCNGERVLESLAAAIEERGGQRRARQQLLTQLRTLRKRLT